MDKAKNQMTPTIKEQIIKVRDTAETNMFDCHAVMRIAEREGWHELADYLSDKKNWPEYNHLILTGDKEGGAIDTRYNITQAEFFGRNWLSGKIGNLNFQAKVYKEDSRFGINNGNVSKLMVWPEYGPIIVNYDRGWDIKPKNAEEEKIVQTILDYCSHVYDGLRDSGITIGQEEKR